MEAPSDSPASVYTHFVTFTLQPSMNGKGCRQQLRQSFKPVLTELQKVSNQYFIVAELTKKANIHYHAVIQFNETEHFTKDDLSLILQDNCKSHKYIGRMECEPIKDTARVMDYLIKDLERTDKVVNNNKNKTTLDIKHYWERVYLSYKPKPPIKLKNYMVIETYDNSDNEDYKMYLGDHPVK